MALVIQHECSECHATVGNTRGSFSHNAGMCHSCFSSMRLAKKQVALTALNQLPMEERIKLLEEWMYDQQNTLRTQNIFTL